MNNYVTFLKKELVESARTYKLLIMLCIFALFGVASPMLAKLIPDILSSAAMDGMVVTIPTPTALDAWTQFFKNLSQICLFVTVIVFSGVLSVELSKGTLINLLTKGLSRTTVILSKFSGMLLIWTASYALSVLLSWWYTGVLFPGQALSNVFFSVFCLWLFGVFLLALLLFASTLLKNRIGCLLVTGGAVVVLSLLELFQNFHRFNPLALSSDNTRLLTNAVTVPDMAAALAITGACIAGFVTASVLIFRKRQL